MKLTIIKKTIKEGVSERTGSVYKIRNLFVKFDEKEVYEKIVSHLKSKGATEDHIAKFCKPSEYNGNVNYAFGLGCSGFTFDKVEQFGILDANVLFDLNDSGFINAKIQVVDKKEKVNGYEAPESEVTGWTNGDYSPAKEVESANPADSAPKPPQAVDISSDEDNSLPF